MSQHAGGIDCALDLVAAASAKIVTNAARVKNVLFIMDSSPAWTRCHRHRNDLWSGREGAVVFIRHRDHSE